MDPSCLAHSFIENLFPSSAYCNDPKFSDRKVWANSADPDQTAPIGAFWSVSSLFAIPFASSGCIT